MSQELSRNDAAAFTLFKKMLARLAENREEHMTRVTLAQQAYSAFSQLNGISNAQLAQQQYLRAAGFANPAALLQMASHSHSISSPSAGPYTASWTPYITNAEWEVFEAYMRGEDVLLHLLAEER